VKTEEQDFIDVETVETVDISADGQSVMQKTKNEITDCNDIVDVSDSSQTSHTGIKIESAGEIRCDTQNKASVENADEIEVVSIVKVKIDADNEIVVGEEKQDRVIQNLCGKRSFVTAMSCTDAVGKPIPPMAMFKREGYHSAFADGFPIVLLVTIPDSRWIKEKCSYDLSPLLRTVPLTVRYHG
jgi:hypothetical protein